MSENNYLTAYIRKTLGEIEVNMIYIKNVFKGVKEMKRKHDKVNYNLSFGNYKKVWFHAWTPVWHEGRGPYISIGVVFFRFLRGY